MNAHFGGADIVAWNRLRARLLEDKRATTNVQNGLSFAFSSLSFS